MAQRDSFHRILLNSDDVDLDPNMTLPVTNARNVRALTFDAAHDMLYWVEDRDVIRRAKADDGSQVRDGIIKPLYVGSA